MSYKPNDPVVATFLTSSDTLTPVDADSTPTGTFIRNGVDDGAVTVTVANVATGRYKASFTIPSGAVAGDDCELVISATIGSLVRNGVVWRSGKLDSKRVGDLNDVANEPDNAGIATAASAATQAASDTATIIAAIDAIKGVGWTAETLKAIFDQIQTPPTATEINNDWDAGILEDGHTRADSLRLGMRGVAARTFGMEPGSLSGGIRDMADTKDSVVAVLDGFGNRTEITTADGT